MRLPIVAAALILLLLSVGAKAQRKTVPPVCAKVRRVHGSFPTGPFKALPSKSYKRSPTVKFLIQEDGSVSDASIIRSSGVADIDRKVLDSVSGWKYEPSRAECGVIENQMTAVIHFAGYPVYRDLKKIFVQANALGARTAY